MFGILKKSSTHHAIRPPPRANIALFRSPHCRSRCQESDPEEVSNSRHCHEFKTSSSSIVSILTFKFPAENRRKKKTGSSLKTSLWSYLNFPAKITDPLDAKIAEEFVREKVPKSSLFSDLNFPPTSQTD